MHASAGPRTARQCNLADAARTRRARSAPTRMSWMPVVAPVETSWPAFSGKPRARSDRARTRARPAGRRGRRRRCRCRPERSSTNVSLVSLSRLRGQRQFGIAGPTMRPALLPKSETTTGGPSSLIVASGLPASLDADVQRADQRGALPPRVHCGACRGRVASEPQDELRFHRGEAAFEHREVAHLRAARRPRHRARRSARPAGPRPKPADPGLQDAADLPALDTSSGHCAIAASWHA